MIQKAFRRKNGSGGFEETGIFPLDRAKITAAKLEKSILITRQSTDSEDSDRDESTGTACDHHDPFQPSESHQSQQQISKPTQSNSLQLSLESHQSQQQISKPSQSNSLQFSSEPHQSQQQISKPTQSNSLQLSLESHQSQQQISKPSQSNSLQLQPQSDSNPHQYDSSSSPSTHAIAQTSAQMQEALQKSLRDVFSTNKRVNRQKGEAITNADSVKLMELQMEVQKRKDETATQNKAIQLEKQKRQLEKTRKAEEKAIDAKNEKYAKKEKDAKKEKEKSVKEAEKKKKTEATARSKLNIKEKKNNEFECYVCEKSFHKDAENQVM